MRRLLTFFFYISALAVAQVSIGPGVSINAASYGCIGNGSTNNDICLMAINAALVASGGGTVFFPAGNYFYTKSYWLQGVKNATIQADGVTFTNNNGAGGFDLQLNCGYWGVSANPNNTFTHWNGGNLIQTADAGDAGVTLVSLAAYSQYNIGDYVFVAGYDQQDSGGGYPPNLRYNEIHKVTAVNSSTGFITLDMPLRFLYDSRWYNSTQTNGGITINIGAPVIIDLDRPTGAGSCVVTRNITIGGATFANNPNGGDEGYPTLGLGSVSTAGVVNFICNSCRIGYEDISESGTVINNDTFVYLWELDKDVDQAICNRCTLFQVNDGTGIRDTIIRDSSIHSDGANFICLSRTVHVENSKFFFNPGNGNSTSNFVNTSGGDDPVESVTLIGNTFYQSVAGGGTPRNNSIIGSPYMGTTTTLTAPTSSSMTVAADFTNVPNGIDYGSRMWTASFAKTATVTAIYYNGTNITIEGTFSSSPATNDVWFFPEEWNVTLLGNVYLNQNTTNLVDIAIGQGATAGQARYINSVNSDFNRVSATDPGCTSGSFPSGYPGKLWISTADPNNTVKKMCMATSGSLDWVTF